MHLIYKLTLICLYSLIFSSSTLADTVVMKDGSVLMGEILKQEDNKLTLKTTYAGTLSIKWDQVKSFQSKEPIIIMLKTDELISTRYMSNTDDGISQIKKKGENWKTAFKTKNVAYVNPDPWRLNEGYKITGNANFSLKSRHGNTIKDEIEMDGKLVFRSLMDRFSFAGNLENDNSNGTTTEDNWLISGKYDYFTSKKRFYGLVLSFERDKFTDLDLRTTFGPYIGRQFYETRALNLSANVGFSKIYEDYIEASDDDYVALNWHADYDQYFLNEFTQFYHEQRGIWNIENTNKMTFDSWTGFRFPLKHGLVASAELEFEYDNAPQQGVHKTDTTYRLKLGYRL